LRETSIKKQEKSERRKNKMKITGKIPKKNYIGKIQKTIEKIKET
jgi:hypothetical protein